jgi:hypothetical protein
MNIKKHHILEQCYNLSRSIEECGASEKLTQSVIKVSDLMIGVEKIVDEIETLKAKQIEDGIIILHYDDMVKQLKSQNQKLEKENELLKKVYEAAKQMLDDFHRECLDIHAEQGEQTECSDLWKEIKYYEESQKGKV